MSPARPDFDRYGFSWARLRRGLEGHLARFPDAHRHLQFLLWSACHYGDPEAASGWVDRPGAAFQLGDAAIWGSESDYRECRELLAAAATS